MKKILFLLFFFLAIFLFSPSKIYAATCTVSPNPVLNNGTQGSNTTLTLTISGGTIDTTQKYYADIIDTTSGWTKMCSGSVPCQSGESLPTNSTSITLTWNSTSLVDTTPNAYQITLFNVFGQYAGCQTNISVTSTPPPPPPTVYCASSGVAGAGCYKYSCYPPDAPSGLTPVAATCTGADFSCCAPSTSVQYTCGLHGGSCLSTGRDCAGTTDTTLTCNSGICCLPPTPPQPPPNTSCSDSSVCCACTGAQPAVLQNLSLTGTEDWECIAAAGSTTSFRYSPTRQSACTSPLICDATGKGCVVDTTNPDCNIPGTCTGKSGTYALQCDSTGCDTALGHIGTTPLAIIKSIFVVALSIVGSLAVLLIILSGYRLTTSRGNPEQVKGAQEQLTAAVIGLLFVIFSLVFLEAIGIDILGLPITLKP